MYNWNLTILDARISIINASCEFLTGGSLTYYNQLSSSGEKYINHLQYYIS